MFQMLHDVDDVVTPIQNGDDTMMDDMDDCTDDAMLMGVADVLEQPFAGVTFPPNTYMVNLHDDNIRYEMGGGGKDSHKMLHGWVSNPIVGNAMYCTHKNIQSECNANHRDAEQTGIESGPGICNNSLPIVYVGKHNGMRGVRFAQKTFDVHKRQRRCMYGVRSGCMYKCAYDVCVFRLSVRIVYISSECHRIVLTSTMFGLYLAHGYITR